MNRETRIKQQQSYTEDTIPQGTTMLYTNAHHISSLIRYGMTILTGAALAIVLCNKAIASGSIDLNGLSTDVWLRLPTQDRASGYMITDLGTNADGGGCGNVGDKAYAYWMANYKNQSSSLISGAGKTPGIGAEGVTGLRLLDSSGGDTGWQIAIGYPDAAFPLSIPSGQSNTNQYNIAAKVTSRGPDLVPNHAYHVDVSGFTYIHIVGSLRTGVCTSTVYGALNVNTWTWTQLDQSSAQISYFDGTTLPSGLATDGTILGRANASTKGTVGGQTIAMRWSSSGWKQGSGSYTGARYTVLNNGTGGAMTVALDCGVHNDSISNGGGSPGYIFSDTDVLQCNVVKAGDENVIPGNYKMSIQAAVRTP
jgi:hypothetical protein